MEINRPGLRASGRDKLGSYIEDNQTDLKTLFQDYLGLEQLPLVGKKEKA